MFVYSLHFLLVLIVIGATDVSSGSFGPLPGKLLPAEIVKKSVQSDEEITWMLIPDGNGVVQIGVLSGLEPRTHNTVEDLRFLLWTRENPYRAEQQILNSTCVPYFEYFNPLRPSKVLIHGFADSSQESILFSVLKDALLTAGDYNIFAVDWGKMAAAPWYFCAAKNTKRVARHTAAFLDFMALTYGAELKDFEIIGFSLGAHVAGMTGQHVQSDRIGKIMGLDPASILFEEAPLEAKLDEGDGRLVEVIHTTAGYLGLSDPMGHRDFFPNGGFWPQPGCKVMDFLAVCSHRRAYYYLAEAIERGSGFSSMPCQDWMSYQNGLCKNKTFTIGIWNNYDRRVEGKFFLRTNSESPFSVD